MNIAGDTLDPFFNINTPEDLDYARSLIARGTIAH